LREATTGFGALVFREMLQALSEPLMILSAARHIRFANAAASAALKGGDGLSLRNRALIGTDPDLHARLVDAVSVAANPGGTHSILMRPRQDGRCAVLHLSPLCRQRDDVRAPEVLVLAKISPNGMPRAYEIGQLRQAFGLSQAEGEIAMLIAAGLSPRQIAERRLSSQDTVRWHIKNIFSKTYTTRLADLMLQLSAARSPFFVDPSRDVSDSIRRHR
jgi:DNA-binding CsgD family transcriptional regulator